MLSRLVKCQCRCWHLQKAP